MSDFAQSGLIATLQRLNETHLSIIEAELVELARAQPIGLVLPCLATDLVQPAPAHIAKELSGAKFLAEIVLSINGCAQGPLPDWAHGMTVLWNDPHPAEAGSRGGKGENIAAGFRHLAANTQCTIFAAQDCDVTSFRRHDLARLCYSIAHPDLGFRFAKMYYSRATDQLYGRVSRLFLAPLLRGIERVLGRLPLVEFLRSFRYPLAGEVALTRGLAITLPAKAGWALELGVLCEVFRRVDPRKVCDVEGGAAYEHKHQAAPVLARMAAEIAQELFAQLSAEGALRTPASRADLAEAYEREAREAVQRSRALAIINALPYDEAGETKLVSTFLRCISAGSSSPREM